MPASRGGPHVIYGRGVPCIDKPVNAFLLRGRTPSSRRITCPGAVVEPYRGVGSSTTSAATRRMVLGVVTPPN